jgi:hypothetical protein
MYITFKQEKLRVNNNKIIGTYSFYQLETFLDFDSNINYPKATLMHLAADSTILA